ncbi:ATP-binding cassette domain-containing protein [Pseudomonadales bacterium]|jgi:ABC-2 type transport system ATP-binding protein|nr:ATP-binding cassette domain-containing protein [Pseudomonadales bacterium]MDA7771415.1 ATP-binding cassette domain-containing protein [Pseudomonadales bacterium]MDA8879549.1 ATP-binding cassette domain-containing protein [Pseudomonadales bacterium]MDC1018133.1 ATP-binding cassette domain-containing protein [Pseudomonadales bacterium]|tara:strand:+ start:1354 stop:2295 length:942 start_codon:yes stop_codon:yes gene_type:complete
MIEVSHLVKNFGSLVAVDNLSLRIAPGEILGFLGPNGAGKSTTMKILTGYLKPTSGTVKVNGISVVQDPVSVKQLIGYLPEGAPAYEEMTTRRFLTFIAELRGYTGHEIVKRLDRVVDEMSLSSVIDRRIETLSKGFKRRVGIAQAIIHDPKILILDEPTDGLDPNQKHQVRELIRGLSKDKIIIVSTHILEEVTAVCSRAVIISDGKILEDCEPSTLETRSKYHGAVTLICSCETDFARMRVATKALVADMPPIVDEDAFRMTLFQSESSRPLLLHVTKLLEETGIVADVVSEKGRLDEVFRSITKSAEVLA